jgi:hypothetical protein
MPEKYSFCESVYAGPRSAWHIRELTEAGKKMGGGIDTATLCERVKQGWDLEVDINEFHLENQTCKDCLEVYRGRKDP